MGKKKKFAIVGTIGVLGITSTILVQSILSNKLLDQDKDIGLEKNYGISYVSNTINTNNDGTIKENDIDIDSIVLCENDMEKKLTDAGYEIKKYDKTLVNNENVVRIYAKKDHKYFDISYCENEVEAKRVFEAYEKKYSDYYLMAQNSNYVYCVSDNKTFKDAGFTSLANVGIQYINHDKY